MTIHGFSPVKGFWIGYSLVSNTSHTGIRDTADFEVPQLCHVSINHKDIHGIPFQGQSKAFLKILSRSLEN